MSVDTTLGLNRPASPTGELSLRERRMEEKAFRDIFDSVIEYRAFGGDRPAHESNRHASGGANTLPGQDGATQAVAKAHSAGPMLTAEARIASSRGEFSGLVGQLSKRAHAHSPASFGPERSSARPQQLARGPEAISRFQPALKQSMRAWSPMVVQISEAGAGLSIVVRVPSSLARNEGEMVRRIKAFCESINRTLLSITVNGEVTWESRPGQASDIFSEEHTHGS